MRRVRDQALCSVGFHLNKPLRPGIVSLQRTDAMLNQSEEFSVRGLTNVLLVSAFCTVSSAVGLPLFVPEAAAYKFNLSEFS